jgi:hypothetical protein
VRRQTGVHQLCRAATAFTSGLFKSDPDLLLLADKMRSSSTASFRAPMVD